jgi:hypothetical protein
MAEQQISLGFETLHTTAPAVVPELREEIAQAWRLPFGQRVEVSLHNGDTIAGSLELVSSPAYPWDPHQPLRLRISGFVFTTKEIKHWVLL